MEPLNLKLSHVSKHFGDRKVLDDFSLDIRPGTVTCLFGPSGCGKTTILNLLAGLMVPTGGSIKGFQNQRISYIFQEVRILPWKTVLANVLFPLNGLMPQEDALRHAREFIRMVGLEKEECRFPGQLSGGMRQRISIARAFAYPSSAILMDEAFQNLDRKLKFNILESFKNIWTKDRRTVVFVTHDEEEAISLGGEVIFLGHQPLEILKRVPVGEVPEGKWKNLVAEIYGQ
ncbi:MAG: ATP-binding cassette domain-containing protein [Bacteroidales bacterium]|nr:ATP-binding cassette domain-containing protein [Bacteroidales bacterium]MDD4812516.1 ATP-binding cassette domain-containing protein [Bacteroidales bacterium]